MPESTTPFFRRKTAVLFIIGCLITIGFLAALEGLRFYTDYLGHGGGDVFLAFAPFCLLPYVLVICVYVGYVMAQVSKGKKRYPWLWAMVGFVMTAGLIISLPILLDPVVHFMPEGHLIFFAPVLSMLITMLLINLGRKSSSTR